MDTPGLVIRAQVPPADRLDQEGAKLLLAPLAGQLPRMAKMAQQQEQQYPTQLPWRPEGPVEDLVLLGTSFMVTQPHYRQRRANRPLAGSQNPSYQQQWGL